MVAAIAGQHRGVNAYHSEGAQADGVEDVHDFLIHFDGAAGQNHLVASYNNKQYHDRNEGK